MQNEHGNRKFGKESHGFESTAFDVQPPNGVQPEHH